MSDLEQSLLNARVALKSDGYQMSIGELANLYLQNELSIDPDFQRNLRWNPSEKVAFIESILMGFPLPSIFVAGNDEGKWDLLDGLQRITTIFQFMGILKDSEGKLVAPLTLKATEHFPSLEGVRFAGSEPGAPELTETRRLEFKRQRMDVKIVLRESSTEMKYELFLRLSTGGTPLSAQDARNAVMAKVDSTFRAWVQELANDERFLETLGLSDRDISRRYNEELFMTFLLLANDEGAQLAEAGEIDGGLGELLSRLVRSANTRLYEYDRDVCEQRFHDVFDFLASRYGEKAFEPEVNSGGVGLRRDAFIVIASAMAEASRKGTIEKALREIRRYWEESPRFATFADAVLWGRALA